MKMRVVLVNLYFPPDTSATAAVAADLVDALTGAGHEITVIAGRPSYDPIERRRWRPVGRQAHGDVTVERVGSAAFDRRRMGGRVANYLSYIVLAGVRAAATEADVVVAMTDPPVAPVVGAVAAGLRRVPLVVNVRDLHPDMAVAAGLVRPGLVTRVWDAAQRWALRRADLVIGLGDDMRQRLEAKGVAANRVVVVRDGAPLPASLPPRDHPVSSEVRSGFSFTVLHAGNLGFGGAWSTLLDAARMLRGERAGFVFVGGGAASDDLRRHAAGLPHVRFLPFRPAGDVAHVLAAGDLHVVSVRRELAGLVVPSKLYPILAAGRPVLAVAPDDSDVARLVREAECGWVVNPEDPVAVADAVKEAMADPVELEDRGRRARELACRFDRPRLLADFVRHLEEVVASVEEAVPIGAGRTLQAEARDGREGSPR